MSQDALLLQEIQRGDEEALGRLIERYTAYVGTIVWNIVRGKLDESDAGAIVSEVFYSLWCNAVKAEPDKLKAYLSSIARSKALNALRRAGREIPLEDDRLELSCPGPEDETLRQAEYAALRRCLDALPEPDRTIFIRRYYYYQSAREIGAELGMNVNTVSTKLRRGRQRLRQELMEGGYFIGSEDLSAL